MLSFRPYQNQDHAKVSAYIFGLYKEDPSDVTMTQDKIDLTIKTLSEKPDLGEIIVFDLDGKVIGYSILIQYWSNEFGGLIISIDELYVGTSYRKQGFATQFFEYLLNRNEHEIAFELEVTPDNDYALNLYLHLGFELDKNRHLFLEK